MTTKRSYEVSVVRSGDWWAITVPTLDGVFSQARRLDQVDNHAREAIAMMLDIGEDEIEISMAVTPPDTVADLLDALHTATETASKASATAAQMRIEAARALHDQGLPLRDVGALIGVSYQRVHQLLAS